MLPRIIASLALLSAQPATAQEVLRLMPDYTFKRVAVPDGSATRRITVQIDPDAPRLGPVYAEPAETDVAADAAPAVPVAAENYGWFWRGVSAKLADASSDRLEPALLHLGNAPEGGLRTPRLQFMQQLAALYGVTILRETLGTRVSPALVLAVIAVESAGEAAATSGAGAQGLMQLMPATAARFDVSDSFAPDQNIRGGIAYLDWLLTEFDNDPIIAIAAYNAGEGNIARYQGVPPFAETRDYVPKVLAAWQIAKGLCMTPPELITDACVFRRPAG